MDRKALVMGLSILISIAALSVGVTLMNIEGSFTKDSILAQGIVPTEVVNAANIENITIIMVESVHSSSPP